MKRWWWVRTDKIDHKSMWQKIGNQPGKRSGGGGWSSHSHTCSGHMIRARIFTPPCSLIMRTGFPTMHILFIFLFCDWGRCIKLIFFNFPSIQLGRLNFFEPFLAPLAFKVSKSGNEVTQKICWKVLKGYKTCRFLNWFQNLEQNYKNHLKNVIRQKL